MKEILLIKTSESEKIITLLDQNNTDYEIVYKDTITLTDDDLAEEGLKKELAKWQEERKRISLTKAHLAEIGNFYTFRKEIEATEELAKTEGIEAYWKLQDKLSRGKLCTHLISYKGIDDATFFCLRLANTLNGINKYSCSSR